MCIGEACIYVFPNRIDSSCVVEYWRDEKRNLVPDHRKIITDIKEIFDEILPGNAIGLYSGGVIHYGVCNFDANGDPLIIHRMPAAEGGKFKNIDPSQGGIWRDKLSLLVSDSKLRALKVYRCYNGVSDSMCRAASLHKAYDFLSSEEDKGYNLLTNNCENFAYNCCNSEYNVQSQQVFERLYAALTTILIFAWLTSGAYFDIGIAEIICGASFLGLVSWQGQKTILKLFLSQVTQRRINFELRRLTQFEPMTTHLAPVTKGDWAKALRQELGIDYQKSDWEGKILKLKDDALQGFYFFCQLFNYHSGKRGWTRTGLGLKVETMIGWHMRFDALHVEGLLSNNNVHLAVERIVGQVNNLHLFALSLSKSGVDNKWNCFRYSFSCLVITLVKSVKPGTPNMNTVLVGQFKMLCDSVISCAKTYPTLFQIPAYDELRLLSDLYWNIMQMYAAFAADPMTSFAISIIEDAKAKCVDEDIKQIYECMEHNLRKLP